MAHGTRDNAFELIRCNAPGKSAICGFRCCIAGLGETVASRQPASGSSVGNMGMRIPRYRLFVVGSLAALQGCGSRWVALAP